MPAGGKGIRLHWDARDELEQSVRFYRVRGGEPVAGQFKQKIEAAFNAIQSDPSRHPYEKKLAGVRKYRLRQFPFSILFIERPDYIWVVAVAHGSRRPGYWNDRLKNT